LESLNNKLLHKIKRVKQFAARFAANCLEAPVIVLLYHRVCEMKNDCQQLAVSPENFDAQIKFLSQNYPVLRFENDWGKVKQTSFVITFDDGYCDNLYNALPVLNKYSVPATFFIASGNIQKGCEFWWDQLEQIILNTKIELDKLGLPIRLTDSKEQAAVQTQLAVKGLPVQERKEFIRQLAQRAEVDLKTRAEYRPLTVDELKQFDANELVTIGSHTVHHPQLSTLPQTEQEHEISTGKKELEEILGHPVNTFSYPFGNTDDFSSLSMDICQENGISKAAANFPGQAHSWTKQLQIPRSLVRNWNIDEFKKQFFRFKYL
jgi:peptidoglycan/xylan/chitin deacetylase (PgdA/CDA1 family)